MEIWKDIVGYEGMYQVSNLGNVKSYKVVPEGRLLVPKENNRRRLWVELSDGGHQKCFLIHRLVAMAFIPNPNNLATINHIDENPHNNRVENLEWMSIGDNNRLYIKNHPEIARNRERRGKYSGVKIAQIYNGNIVAVWDDASAIHRNTPFNTTSIIGCCKGERKHAYGYQWQFAINISESRETSAI